MASTGKALLRELWQGCGSVASKHGLPWDFPHLTQSRAQALQVPFNHPQSKASSAQLDPSLSPNGGEQQDGELSQAGAEESEPADALRVLTTLPFQDTTRPPPCHLSHPLALMCSFSSCSNGSSTFASIYAKKAVKVHTNTTSLSNGSLWFIPSPLKCFS